MLMLVSVFLYVEHNQTPNANNVLNQLDEHAFPITPQWILKLVTFASWFHLFLFSTHQL
ncbi:Uncharacterised protein [Streptococcus pneumoniae]|nr:Uncharacterised protein [Streptococcus pneumoniae]